MEVLDAAASLALALAVALLAALRLKDRRDAIELRQELREVEGRIDRAGSGEQEGGCRLGGGGAPLPRSGPRGGDGAVAGAVPPVSVE